MLATDASPSAPDHRERWFRLLKPRPRRGDSITYERERWEFDGFIWRNRDAEAQALAAMDVRKVESALAVGRMQQKVRDATPGWSDYRDALGAEKVQVREQEDGSFAGEFVRLDEEDKKKLVQMEREKLALMTEQGDILGAGVQETTLRDAEGRTRTVPVQHAERLAKKSGMVEVRKDGRIHTARKKKAPRG